MIKSVYRYQNNNVAVFSDEGLKMHEYDGEFDTRKEVILKNSGPEVEFYIERGGYKFEPVSRKVWAQGSPGQNEGKG